MLLTEPERDRTNVDERYTWNLADIFRDLARWRAEKTRVATEMSQIREYAGRLGSSAQTLADALDLRASLDKDLTRLYVYASMLSDEDTRQSEPQGMQQEMQQLYATFSAHASFMQPEILGIGAERIEELIGV